MNCDRIKPLLDDFAEGELNPPQKQMVEQHLKACRSCQKELSAIRQTIRLLTEFGEVQEPPDFLQQVRQRIARRQRRHLLASLLTRPATTRVLAPVACTVLAAFGIWLAYKQFYPSERTVGYAAEKGARPKVIDRAGATAEKFAPAASQELGTEAGRGSKAGGVQPSKRETAEEAETASPLTENLRHRIAPKAPSANRARGVGVARAEADKKHAEEVRLMIAKRAAAQPERAVKETRLRTRKNAALGEAHDGEKAAEPLEVAQRPRPAQVRSAPVVGKAAEHVAGVALSGEARPEQAAPPVEERKRIAGGRREAAKAGYSVTLPAVEAPPKIEEGLRETGKLKEAPKDLMSYGNGLKALKTPHGKKEEPAPPGDLGLRYRWYSRQVQGPSGEARRGQAEFAFFNVCGRALDVGGNVVAAYQTARGRTPELVLAVKDRQKALAEIRKLVADAGGTIEPAIQEKDKYARAYAALYPDTFVVKLNADAYQRLLANFSAARKSSEAAGITSQSGQPAAGTQALAQQQAPTTFLIRLIEAREESQPQQLPAK